MKLTSYILEDESLAANRLKRILQEVAPDILVKQTFESIEDLANKLLETEQPDILFLDIQVADGNSMELFKIVDVKSKIIFITAYDEYAIQAFRKNATDYLLKPIKRDQLIEAINKARPLENSEILIQNSGYKTRLLLKFGNKLTSIKTIDLAYIYSKNKISYFITHQGDRYPSDYKLQELEELLDPQFFTRANRQFMIHIDSIVNMVRHDASRLKLTLKPDIDQEIVISTERSKLFKDWLKK